MLVKKSAMPVCLGLAAALALAHPVSAQPSPISVGTPIVGQTIQASDGQKIELISDNSVQRGAAEGANVGTDGAVTVTGWAIDLNSKTPAQHVFATEADKVIAVGSTTGARPDIVDGKGASYLKSGFSLTLPAAVKATLKTVRVFALSSDGSAYELSYSKALR